MRLKSEVDDQRRLLGELQRLIADTAGWDDDQRKSLEAIRLDAMQESGKALLETLTIAAEKVSAADRLLSKP